MVSSGTKLKEVVKVAGDSRGVGTALYTGFRMEVYPVIFRVKVVVLLKVMSLKEFLSLKAALLRLMSYASDLDELHKSR